MTNTTTTKEQDTEFQRWDLFKLRALDMAYGIERLHKHAQAYKVLAESAHASNGEMIPTPKCRTADLVMLDRALDHLEERLSFAVDDVSAIREAIEAAR